MSEETNMESVRYPEGMEWDDIKGGAAKMFNIWVGGSELEWAEECWGHFAKGGLLNNEGAVETTVSLLRLVTLALIYQQFCGYAWNENPENEASDYASEIEYDDIVLGYLATIADKYFADGCGEDYEVRNEALNAATRAQREEIFQCLSKAYGGYIQLYARMCKTHPSYAEDDEFEPNEENVDALSFVSDGFPD